MYNLKNKIVLITGAAKGIGAAVAIETLEAGVKHVRVLDVDEAGVSLQNECNEKYGDSKVKFVKCDVTIDEQLYEALDDVKSDYGHIDLLINNAGITKEGNLLQIKKQIEINFIALVNGTLKAIELMRTDKGGSGGTIINIASIAGLVPMCTPLFIYSSIKSAVLQFTTCLAQEHGTKIGVRIVSLCYGKTDTSIIDDVQTFQNEFETNLQEMMKSCPMQTTKEAARGTIEVYQKAETGTTWLIQNGESATDLTPILRKNNEAIAKVIQRQE